MLTQEAINVLLIAMAANIIVVVAVIGLKMRDDRHGHRSHPLAVARAGATDVPPDAIEASRAWFSPAGAGSPVGAGGSRETEVGAAPSDVAMLSGPLPDLGTPAQWSAWVEEEGVRTSRYHRPATIVLVEMAGIDRLASRIGRAGADRLLPPVAATIRRQARAADRIAQLGPARFGILLAETDEVQAINYVERVRTACDLWLAAGAVSLQLAIGWAEFRSDAAGSMATAEAERRLFAERRRFEPASDVPVEHGVVRGRHAPAVIHLGSVELLRPAGAAVSRSHGERAAVSRGHGERAAVSGGAGRQSRPRRRPRPGRSPVGRPSSMTSRPATITVSIPSG